MTHVSDQPPLAEAIAEVELGRPPYPGLRPAVAIIHLKDPAGEPRDPDRTMVVWIDAIPEPGSARHELSGGRHLYVHRVQWGFFRVRAGGEVTTAVLPAVIYHPGSSADPSR